MGALQSAEWYDEMTRRLAGALAEPPWCSPWFPVFSRVVEIIPPRPWAIVELGCGAGALAEMIHAAQPSVQYLGCDFSAENVRIARDRGLPRTFHFSVRDIVAAPVTINRPESTVVLAVEVLEHVHDDVGVLGRIAVGTLVIFTLPDHDSEGHVRWFQSREHVMETYGPLFSTSDDFHELAVETVTIGPRRYFIAAGRRVAPAAPAPTEATA